MTGTSTFRVPRAELTGPAGKLVTTLSHRMWGEVPDVAYVLFHHRKIMWSVFGFERKVGRWKRLDPHLKSYAVMAAAGAIGCSWCLDFGYYLAHEEGLDLDKIREVPRWRESDAFTPLERDVMEFAEAMTATPPTVTDEMSDHLRSALGTEALVELVTMVAVENQRSRINSAAGLTSQGFSDVCEIPLAAPADGVAR